MEEYLESLGIYYDEKVRFLSDIISDKDKKLKCGDCDDRKVFNESDINKFVFTCGSEKKGICGTQITIEFPKYICYEKELSNLRNKIEEGINWSIIGKHLDVDDEIKEQGEKKDKSLLAIQYIEELFNEANMNDKKDKIQKFYDRRIEQTRECKEIKKKLEKENDEVKKKAFRNNYVLNMKQMNEEYKEIKLLVEDINPYLQTEEPKVIIHNKNFEKVSKATKKPKKIKEKKGSPEKPKKTKDSPEKPKKTKDSPEKPKKTKDSPDKFRLNEFKKGIRVSWFAKGQDNFGTVREDFSEGSKTIAIHDDNGKNKKIPYTRLTIVKEQVKEKKEEDFEPEPEQAEDKEEDKTEKEEQKSSKKEENISVPTSVNDLKEGLKIVANYQGQEFNGNIGKVDKRMKKQANVVLYPEEGGEMSVKIPISDIIKIIL